MVNLWFPYQITADITRSVPGQRPRGEALLRLWWAAWLLAAVLNRVAAVRHPKGIDEFRTQTTLELTGAVVEIGAALLAVAVIEMITRDFDNYRKDVLAGRSR